MKKSLALLSFSLLIPLLLIVLLITAVTPHQPVHAVNNSSLIFADGFDSGNTSAWSAAVPRGSAILSTIGVNDAAAIIAGAGTACAGSACGLEVGFSGDTGNAYVQDDSPLLETVYYAGFWFDPHTVSMGTGTSHQIFRAVDASNGAVMTITLGFDGSDYELAVGAQRDNGTWQATTGILLSDAPHHLALNWAAASAPGANDGVLQFWLDNVLRAEFVALDTDTKQVNSVRLGAVAGVDTSTLGSIYFDQFVSTRVLAGTGEFILVTAPNEANLRSAIDSAHDGAIISFPPEMSGQTITLTDELVIDKNLEIDGTGLDTAVMLDGNDSVRVINVMTSTLSPQVEVTLDSLTIANGYAQTNDCGAANLKCGGGIILQNSAVTVTIMNSTLTNNTAVDFGGAVFNHHGTLRIMNSTFSANSAGNQGGGSYSENGTMQINNSTFTNNSAGSGGGAVYNSSGIFHLRNTIAANTPSGTDCFSDVALTADSHNLIESNNGCGLPDVTDDPQLGSLADNGGPTLTHALLLHSPALDAGDAATCLATDQRGVARPVGAACDIGAVEQDDFYRIFLPTVLKP